MKTLILAFMLAAASAGAAYAQSLSCGLAPLPPIGCSDEPICLCSGDSCQWYFPNCN